MNVEVLKNRVKLPGSIIRVRLAHRTQDFGRRVSDIHKGSQKPFTLKTLT
jgi:hypothetical protein